MAAAVLTGIPATRLDVTYVPRPAANADHEVVLRVEACGICGTDLHMLSGESYRPQTPFILGHEPAGLVVETGAAAREWLGKRATITLFIGDGTCPLCVAGDERLCPNLVSSTGVFGANGAYADYVRVHARQLIEVPNNLTGAEAASLVDSGATAANSVRIALTWQPDLVLILGAGPIGFFVAEMLAAHRVARRVIEPNRLRRGALAALGHDVAESFDEVPDQADVVIDCTGAASAVIPGVERVAARGLYVLAGYSKVPHFDFAVVSRKEATIRGIRSGRREDLEALIGLAASRRVRLPALSRWRLSEINDALDALRHGEVDGKAIIVPDDQW